MPFAVETFGAWGKEATAFAKLLQSRATDRGINPLEFYYHFCSELSITLQIGNAKVLESALQAARSGKRPLSLVCVTNTSIDCDPEGVESLACSFCKLRSKKSPIESCGYATIAENTSGRC